MNATLLGDFFGIAPCRNMVPMPVHIEAHGSAPRHALVYRWSKMLVLLTFIFRRSQAVRVRRMYEVASLRLRGREGEILLSA